ncbi:MAG: carbohydrate-binding protein [Paludibacteraceae bacterium]|nr:carbohydrate-binding protein [Paludibacteraceae bacterium]
MLKRVFATILLGIGLSLTNGFSAEKLEVDLTDSIRPVSHCATGALYGMTETLPKDIDGLVAPIKPNLYCLPPEGKDGNQHNFGDAFVVAERLKGTTAKVQVLLADLLPYWPYQWPGKNEWMSMVEDVLKKHKSSGLNNIDSYVIWNEPNETWQDANGDFNKDLGKPTYDLIRKYFPNTKIVGPATSFYSRDRFKNFLTFCKENKCLPDLVCWHQWGSENFAAAAEDYRDLTKEIGIPNLPLCINEYSASCEWDLRKLEGCPGYCVPFISKFERNNVESATISWWFTGLPGRLGSLLTEKFERGGGWWLYKWYGEMTGYMAMVTPPNDKSDGLDGFASVNRKHNYASVIVGGNYKGDANINFTKWPEFLKGKMKVTVERVTWEDKDLPVLSTDLISEEVMNINGTTFSLPLKIESPLYAYRIQFSAVDIPQKPFNGVIATIPGIVEAENYDVAGEGFSYHDSEDENRGGEYRDDCVDIVKSDDGYALGYTTYGEWTEYTVNVEESDMYDVSALVSNGGKVDGFRLFIDNEEITQPYVIPQTGDNWSVYKEEHIATASISKGEHVLKILINGSYVNIDWLKFEKHKGSGVNLLESDRIKTFKNARFYDMEGRRIKADKLKSGKIYIAVTPNKREEVMIISK